MDNQQVKIRIGLVCVGFLIATVVLIMLFGGGKMPRFFSSDYEIFVVLPQAPMLSENSPVYKNGVEIGRVTKIQLVDEDRKVEITARIHGNIKLYTNEECQLSLNLLGQSSLNFTPKPDVPLGEVLAKGVRIDGVTPIDLLAVADTLQSDVSKALHNISAAAEQLTQSFNKINQMIGSPEEVARKQQRLERMVDQADITMTSVNSVLKSVDELISDPEIKEGIKISSTQLPGVIDEGKKLMANINTMTTKIDGLLQKADATFGKVDSNLDNLSSFTESLGSDGSQILESLADIMEQFKNAATQLDDFAMALNSPDGSLGRLINDPEFFHSLNNTIKNANRTIQNIERITVQVQPILKDVNVFSDKIAREPGQLGLKGLLDKSPPVKGIPDAYAGPWGTLNNGMPQQQSERIMLQRTPLSKLFPFGTQQYRNEPMPQQSRYASQVIDLPDDMRYDATPIYDGYPVREYYESPSAFPENYPVGAQLPPQPHRVRIMPLQQSAIPQNPPLVAPQYVNETAAAPVMPPTREPTWTRGEQVDAMASLEIGFDSVAEPALQSPQPLRLASGDAFGESKIVPASAMIPVVIPAEKENRAKNEIPSFTPIF